ncbi:MAG: M48 family metalloprotease [Planctomycetota bacterium]|nr:M48 family metalloprotease [Planctomycetota bacterium]
MFIFGNRGRRGGGGGRWIIAVVIALVGIIGYFTKEKVFNAETGESYRRAMNVDEQKALGLQAAQQMIPKMGGEVPPSRDPDAALVDEVGDRLVRNTDAAKSDFAGNFNFYLVDDPNTINAFALPGGQISITRGLMNRLENEAQLAGVLGHEIGHVIAEHSAQQMAKGQLGQVLATAVGVGASGEDGAGRYAGVAAAMAAQMVNLKYGRDDESQSDTIGLKYMAQAGYDPAEMQGVMRILAEASKGGKQAEFMSSHPHPDTRIATIKAFLEKNKDELSRLTLTKGRDLSGGSRPER